MNLPTLPPVLCHAGDSDCYTPDQMTEYGQQCRKVTFNEITRLQALIKKAQSESELIEYRGEPAIVVPYSFMKAATEMPEQAQVVEPVGYVYWAKGHAEGALDNQNLRPGTPLYTHPAPPPPAGDTDDLTIAYLAGHAKGVEAGRKQAQQVAVPADKPKPLTEREIFDIDPCPHEMFDQQRIDFARAIEAAHGITPQGDTP